MKEHKKLALRKIVINLIWMAVAIALGIVVWKLPK